MSNHNIKQITNFDITKDTETVKKTLVMPNGDIKEVDFASFAIAATPKFGYICEPRGLDYPIFLTTEGVEKKYEIGSTGMFEIQPEIFKNINDNTPEKEVTVFITNVKVPVGIQFKIDYALPRASQ